MTLPLIKQQVRLYHYVLDLAAAVNRGLCNVRSKCHPHFLLSLLKYTTMAVIDSQLSSSNEFTDVATPKRTECTFVLL